MTEEMNKEYMEMLRKNIPQLDMALHINKSNVEKIYRQEDFINYIKKNYIKIFNEANNYAYDKQQKENNEERRIV
jgi:hypothetical protein|tara:strand:- start:49 stop:273 length:225 start_codon:yes stop_codon:yes gene_type:complete